ncbi:MAG TPA: MFS transporter [Patescibacteria group bacterium]|nr:MFS transporter [Patescibacteria group bacterium]
MLIGGIALGLILGLLAGGSLANLASVRLRWVAVLMFAVILRFGTEFLLVRGSGLVELIRLPLFFLAFALLLAALWVNRTQPGMRLAFVGILSNTIAITANGGHMPIWIPSLEAAGFKLADLTSPFHVPLAADLDADFLWHAGPLADILPIPLPFVRNVASIGDVFLTAGLAFFLFATVVRTLGEDDQATEALDHDGPLTGLAGATRMPRGIESALGRQRLRPGTGLATGFAETASLDRPLVLGGRGTGLAGPSAREVVGRVRGADGKIVDVWAPIHPTSRAIALAPVPSAASAGTYDDGAIAVPGRPRVEVPARVRRHPYVRLALNGSFSALWTGHVISMFGDRIHQIALAFLVLGLTGNAIAVAFVFVAATIPNLLLSPLAGAYVDRWNQRDVMIVSDLLRAAAVLMVPIVAVTSVLLVYPLIFLITSISIFFRPARVAILPRIVRDDELLTANSAMWAGETFADVIGYPLAGIFVVFLGPALPLAFWVDAATYAASAILIATIAVPAVQRRTRLAPARGAMPAHETDAVVTMPEPEPELPRTSVFTEMMEGYRFLRSEPVLFANTIQAAFAQFAIGSLTALTPVFVERVLNPVNVGPEAAYAFLETAIGAGNLIGGFVIGLIGIHLAKGRMVIGGYVLWGLFLIAFALSGNLVLDFGILFGAGVANMIFVIPSQTLFQQRTPSELIGRVVGFRFALVFGSMTLAMGVGGILGQTIGIVPVLVVSGVVTVLAGLAGLLVPEMRDA